MYRFANSSVGPATADIATHRGIDFVIRRIRRSLQQCNSAHDLPGLAVAALRDIEFTPRNLHRVTAVLG
jgi:hypothetical protein